MHKREEFLGDDGKFPPRDLLREEFRPVIKRLKLYYKGFGWHALRRENISARQLHGGTPIEAMKAAGHNSVDMTLLYTLIDPTHEAAQVDKIFAQMTPKTDTAFPILLGTQVARMVRTSSC